MNICLWLKKIKKEINKTKESLFAELNSNIYFYFKLLKF